MSVILDPKMRAFAESQFERFLQFWKDLLAIESNSYNIDGVNRVGDAVEAFAAGLGFSCRRHPMEHSASGVVIEYNNGSDKEPVMFGAHMDTVLKLSDFPDPPIRIDAERKLHGPGVMDDKSGIVTSLFTMYLLKEFGYTDRPVKLVLAVDEEISNALSGEAGKEYLRSEARSAFCAFNMEGALLDRVSLNVERFGILTRRIDITGVGSHAGHGLKDGRSAIQEAAHKLLAIEAETDTDCLTFNCGLIEGGKAANAVPVKCSITFDIRFRTEADGKRADEILRRETEHAYVEGTHAELVEINSRPPMICRENSKRFLEYYNDAHEAVYGIRLRPNLTRGGSDAAYFTQVNCPTVDSMSLWGGRSHSAEEWCEIDSLVPRAFTLATAVMHLPGSF